MKNDTVYRQDAIDAMCDACSDFCDEGVCEKVSAIQKLSSAQPDFSCDGCQTPKHICGICMRNYPNITDHYCTGEWAERREDA